MVFDVFRCAICIVGKYLMRKSGMKLRLVTTSALVISDLLCFVISRVSFFLAFKGVRQNAERLISFFLAYGLFNCAMYHSVLHGLLWCFHFPCWLNVFDEASFSISQGTSTVQMWWQLEWVRWGKPGRVDARLTLLSFSSLILAW